MPNRILKESVCTSDSIAELSWFEEVLFYRLIVSCDDYGRYDGRPAIIMNRLFPLSGDDVTIESVTAAVNNLAAVGMVNLYESEGKPYIAIPSWNKHQNVRAKRSRYPEPVNILQSLADNSKQMYTDASKSPRNPIQSNPIQSSRSRLPRAPARTREDDTTTQTDTTRCEKCGAKITEGVASYSRDRFGKLLCQKCQAAAPKPPAKAAGAEYKPDPAVVRKAFAELEAEEREPQDGGAGE